MLLIALKQFSLKLSLMQMLLQLIHLSCYNYKILHGLNTEITLEWGFPGHIFCLFFRSTALSSLWQFVWEAGKLINLNLLIILRNLPFLSIIIF